MWRECRNLRASGVAKTLPRATGIEKPKTTSGEYKIAAAARAARRIETQIAREAAEQAAFTDAIVTGMLRREQERKERGADEQNPEVGATAAALRRRDERGTRYRGVGCL